MTHINSYNVLDKFKNMSVDEIRQHYLNNRISAAIAMSHMEHDFNLSNVIRTDNFFGLREAYYVGGKKHWDRRGSVGTHHYTPISYCENEEIFWEIVEKKGYIPIAVENNIEFECKNIFNYVWPLNPIIIFGEEMTGIPTSVLKRCRDIVTIPSFGSVRSLNVGSAAAVAISMFRRQIGE